LQPSASLYYHSRSSAQRRQAGRQARGGSDEKITPAFLVGHTLNKLNTITINILYIPMRKLDREEGTYIGRRGEKGKQNHWIMPTAYYISVSSPPQTTLLLYMEAGNMSD
jgi:hypothetical protein